MRKFYKMLLIIGVVIFSLIAAANTMMIIKDYTSSMEVIVNAGYTAWWMVHMLAALIAIYKKILPQLLSKLVKIWGVVSCVGIIAGWIYVWNMI